MRNIQENGVMCYTGTCPYEDFVGECTLSVSKSFPDDAWCVLIEKEEESECQNETSNGS